jgi:hypothetical protein
MTEISAALVLSWMNHLVPLSPHKVTFDALSEGIAEAANEDPDPVDAAATLVAIGYYESHFNLDAVSSEDDPATAIGYPQVSTEWIKFPASPTFQSKMALSLIRDSQTRCGTLAEYASGSCDSGRDEGARRAKLAAKLKFSNHVFIERRLDMDPILAHPRRKEEDDLN